MDITPITLANPVGPHAPAAWAEPSLPPQPPAELVQKFQALMDRGASLGADPANDSPMLAAAVERADNHIGAYQAAMDNMLSLDPSTMSTSDFMALQVQTSAQLSVLAMNQQAYFSALSASKDSVSDLLKNQ